MKELIVIEQLPVIKEKLKALSEEIDEKVEKAKSLVCTEESVKEIKKARAALNKEFEELEEQRKYVKNTVLKPYMDFEDTYKKFISDRYKAADSDLKLKIQSVETELKQKKEQEIKWYFGELIDFHKIDFVKFEQVGINVTLSASIKSLKERVKSFVDGIADDLELIKTQEFQSEILYEYKKTLNVSNAISTVASRHKTIEAEKERQRVLEKAKEAEEKTVEKVEEFSAPLIHEELSEEPIGKIVFQVTATISKLRELKRFLENGGYDYEQQ